MGKATGATRLGRDSQPKSLGIKISDGQVARSGMVIVRQRGTKYFPGKNVKRGGDDTLYAMKEGKVRLRTIRRTRFDGSKRIAKVVDVITVSEKKF